MIRMQIQLTEAQARMLKAQAARESRSMSDVVRESVSNYLVRRGTTDRADLVNRARNLPGRFRSGISDLAENHDRYLDEAFDA